MLDWLGEADAAVKLMECVERVSEAGICTRDLGGEKGTKEVTEAVVEEIRKLGRK